MEKKWVVVVLIVAAVAGIWWYRDQRPANMQAVIAGVRDASNVTDVMTVETISEGSASLVGRHISIPDARVTDVTGQHTFWVVGSEGKPLLVVIAPDRDGGLKLTSGDRVSISGAIRAEASKFPLSSEDAAQIAKASFHVFATDVRQVR